MASAPTKARRTRSPASRKATSSRSAAKRAAVDPTSLAGFVEFCGALILEDGTPLVVHDFQQTMLSDYFDGVIETLILISKKNGKTTILAALALHHLLVTPDAECVIGAASRDQAQILLGQARGLVRRSGLSQYVDVKQREIVSLRDEGRVRVLASDANTADGVIPTLALVDELHRHKDDGAMYGVFHDGLGPRNGRIITISTAGDDEESPLGTLRRKALQMPNVTKAGAYRYCRSDDFAMHEWALAPDADRDDMKVVKGANPAPWQTLKRLATRHDSPSMTPWRWARFACGVWLRGEGKWLESGKGWYDGRENFEEPEPGEPIVIGWDPSFSFDSTGIVALRVDSAGAVRAATVWPLAIIRPQDEDGGKVAAWRIKEVLLSACAKWKVLAVGYDRNRGFQSLAEELANDHNVPITVVPVSADVWAPLTADMMAAINRGSIANPGDTPLAQTFGQHVLNGEVKQSQHGERLHGKPKDRTKVDALMAMGMAWHLAFDGAESDEIYADRDLITSGSDDPDDDDELPDLEDDDDDFDEDW